MKLLQVRKRGVKDGFHALSQPEEVPELDDSSYPSKPPRNLESNSSKRGVRSLMSNLTQFKSRRSLSKERVIPVAEDSLIVSPKEMTLDTVTTESLSYSRSIDVHDDTVEEDFETPSNEPRDDAFVNGETTFASSEAHRAFTDQRRTLPELISITSFESPSPRKTSPSPIPFITQKPLTEKILEAAVAAEIPETTPVEPLASADEKPRYSHDILSGPMFDTPVRKYIFSDRFEDFSVEDSTCASSVSLQEELSALLFNEPALGTRKEEVDTETVHSIEHASPQGDESMFSTYEGIDSYGTYDSTTVSRSFDNREKEWDLPPNVPKFIKTLAVALQDFVEDVGNCSSYTLDQARQVEWVETMENRASKALCDLQALASTNSGRPKTDNSNVE